MGTEVESNKGMTKLVDIRCSCGKLLGKVQEGAAHEHKCPRCKQLSALYQTRLKEGFPVIVPKGFGPLKDGDKFTIAGVQHMPDGTTIGNCKPGEETVMIARIEA